MSKDKVATDLTPPPPPPTQDGGGDGGEPAAPEVRETGSAPAPPPPPPSAADLRKSGSGLTPTTKQSGEGAIPEPVPSLLTPLEQKSGTVPGEVSKKSIPPAGGPSLSTKSITLAEQPAPGTKKSGAVGETPDAQKSDHHHHHHHHHHGNPHHPHTHHSHHHHSQSQSRHSNKTPGEGTTVAPTTAAPTTAGSSDPLALTPLVSPPQDTAPPTATTTVTPSSPDDLQHPHPPQPHRKHRSSAGGSRKSGKSGSFSSRSSSRSSSSFSSSYSSSYSSQSFHEGEGWQQLHTVKMSEHYVCAKLRDFRTQLELIHAKIPGPHIHCYIIIPHKLDDDLGLPHLLQHMLWQGGSKNFPYPFLLQKVTNRCFSSDLKSWVEKDHSCYFFTSAGLAGFEQLLPVLFDHIYEPELSEATFLQEVYRMEGTGQDLGACLEEILEIEKTPEEFTTLELVQKIFGFGVGFPYGFSFAGSSEALRQVNLGAVDKVKEFHNKYYHLSNTCVVICGDISKEEVCTLLEPLLERYKSVGYAWRRPWSKIQLIPPISQSIYTTIEYPSYTANPLVASVVKVGILGPNSTEKLNRCVAIRLVLHYLCLGPLKEAFDNYKKTYLTTFEASQEELEAYKLETTVTLAEYEWRQTLFVIEIRNLPQDLASHVPDILKLAMEEQVQVQEQKFNLAMMAEIVDRVYQEDLSQLENTPGEKITHSIIPDYIYGKEDSDLMFDRRVNSPYTIHHFLNQPADFWKYLIQDSILNTNWVTVVAVPSKKVAADVEKAEAERLQMRLNDENIIETKRIAQRSKAALKLREKMREQDVSMILEQFKLPPVDSIGFTKLSRHDNPKWANDTLVNFYFDDIQSHSVYLTVMMDTSELRMEDKKYLVLLSEALMRSPYTDQGEVFRTGEELVQELQRNCLSHEIFFGLEWFGKVEQRTRFSCGTYPHLLCLRFKLHVSKIKEGFKLSQMILWNTKWQAEVLKDVCRKLVKEVDEELKVQGQVMTRVMLTDSLYNLNSVPSCISLVRQKMFLRRIGEELPQSMRRIAKQLEAIRMTLLRPENVTVHVAGSMKDMEFNLTEDPNARDALRDLFRTTFDYTGWHWGYHTKRLSNAPDTAWMKSLECIAKCSKEQVLRMPTTTPNAESCHLVQACPGIRSWMDGEYPLVLLAMQYFIQDSGGPLEKALVEGGLAREIDLRANPAEGLIFFEMWGVENLAKSYGAAYDVLQEHVQEATKVILIEREKSKMLKDMSMTPTPSKSTTTEEKEESSEAKTLSKDDPKSGGAGGGEVKKWEIWSEELLTAAKSSLIFRLTKMEGSPENVGMLSLLAYYKGTGIGGAGGGGGHHHHHHHHHHGHHHHGGQGTFWFDKGLRGMQERVANADMLEVMKVTEKYLRPLILEPCTCAASAPKEQTIPMIKELLE